MDTLITGIYDFRLLVLSIAIALLAAYTALDLVGQVRTSDGYVQIGWLTAGAIVMGTGIWSMHFVGMLAFCLPIPVQYDVFTILLSILAAILASACALFFVSQEVMSRMNLLGGSLLMGFGITTMHYTGMAAMRLQAKIHYNYFLVGLSVAIAFVVSLAALWLAFHLPDRTTTASRRQKIGSAIIWGMAIPTMHYTGMTATSFHATNVAQMPSSWILDASGLASTISIFTFAILGLALLISLEKKTVDRTVALINLQHEIAERQQVEKQLQLEQARKLEETLKELKQTQAQLIQSEKISSLGQLVAGIAHEVNNPVTFISGNLSYAYQYVEDLIYLLNLYRKQCPNPSVEIKQQIEAIDLNYLLEDLPKMISSMKFGTDRIQEIMQSLRNFSRLDGNNKKTVDIHEGIDTTLMILQHRLKAESHRPTIQVVKQYGKLPLVECYVGQLNQVFMNLLANAIDALEESNKGKTFAEIETNPNMITICTSANEHDVIIKIADNGPGIPEEVRVRLFDAFFTTKAEGKGTGLGLAICHQIITDIHGGSLQCFSTLGKGTEFVIQIPIAIAVTNRE
ncbi:integral membrane sensor signal transduction histidine kinase [Nostoc sp. NIES-4103]|nr:integral membrane sensor signal transduction histidine kinase [Nostoc sp. NIES-4103]